MRRHGFAAARLLGAALLAAAVLQPAAADPAGERLAIATPPGYHVAYRAHVARSSITEMTPAGETVDDWSEMVTVQVFRQLGGVSPAAFRKRLFKAWSACPGSSMTEASDGRENGYPVASWTFACPRNPQTGKPEITMFKAVAGRKALYLVQKAFKRPP